MRKRNSIGAMVREAEPAEKQAGFHSKIAIAKKKPTKQNNWMNFYINQDNW